MPKFYSIPGLAPSGGEGKMGGRHSAPKAPTREDLQRQYPKFMEKLAGREDLGGNFANPGDHFDLHGDRAVVEHVEHNGGGEQDLIVRRETNLGSGTYRVKVKETGDQSQTVTDVRLTHD